MMFRFLLSLMATLAFAASLAQAQFGSPRAEVALIAERSQVQVGEIFYAGFDMQLEPGWHVYWRNPGDSGLPTEVVWDEGSGEGAGDFLWPAPHELVVLENELLDYGYSDRVVLPFQVSVPEDASGAIALTGELRYLICKEVCIPEEATFNLSLLVGDKPIVNQGSGTLIAEWIGRAPTAFEGQARLVVNDESKWGLSLASDDLAEAEYVRFFPYNDEIKHAAGQTLLRGDEGVTLELTPGLVPDLGNAIEGLIVVEQEGRPRVAYELTAEVGDVGLTGTQGQVESAPTAPAVNLLTVAGLALLGGILLNLMPCVLPVLSIKAIGMVTAAAQGDAGHLKRHGLWYAAGVVLSFIGIAGAFVALRSAGQFLPIGFQLQYPVVVACLALLMFVIGLWLLGVFELGGSLQNIGSGLTQKQGSAGAFFTGVLAAVVGAPCIGPFLGVALGAVASQPALIVFLVFGLVGLGLALPFLAISFMPGLQTRLPKPGAWMERLKQFFAFPMFLTGVWLLSVLGNQAGLNAVVWTASGAAFIGFGIWALKTAGGKFGALGTGFGALMLLAGLGLPVSASLNGAPAAQTGVNTAYSGAVASEVWSEAAVTEALDEGRGVFVDFTATWCASCQLNKWRALKKPAVHQAFMDNDIVFMVADFTNRDPEIAAALQKHNQPGVPMYLYYAPGSRNAKLLPQLLSIDLILDEIDA